MRAGPLGLALSLLLGAVLTTACTAPKLAYNRLDWLASWYVGKYVSFSAEQKQGFDADVEQLWVWHRREQLTLYARDLRELAQVSQQPLSSAALAVWVGRADAHWNRLVVKLAPAACAEMATFSAAQIASTLQRLDRNIARDAKQFTAPPVAVIRRESEQRLSRSLRYWLGDLDKSQRQRMEQWNAQRELTYADWLDHRRLWRSHFAQVLAVRKSTAFCGQLQQLFITTNQAEQGLGSRYDGDRAQLLDFLAQFSATLSPQQRKHLRKELLELAAEFESLAAE